MTLGAGLSGSARKKKMLREWHRHMERTQSTAATVLLLLTDMEQHEHHVRDGNDPTKFIKESKCAQGHKQKQTNKQT